MPQPTRSDVHVSKPLSNISVAYIQQASDFVADKVFPVVPVQKQADRYFKYTKDYWFRTQAAVRAPSSESAGSGFGIDNTPNFFCDVLAVHKDVDDQTRVNADQPLDMDRDATMFVTQQMLLKREIDFMNKYLAASTWTGASDFTPSTKWDQSTGDPMADIDTKKQAIKAKTGFMPNVFMVTPDVHYVIKNNAKVLDRIKYTQTGLVTEDLLSSLFGVKYLVAWGVQNTAAEGQTASMGFLKSDSGLLVYAAPNPGLLQPSGGYIFSWAGLFGAGALGTRIINFRMEHLKSDRIEGEMAYDMNLVGADLGCYFNDMVT